MDAVAPPTLAISDSTFGSARHGLGDLLLIAHHLVIRGALRGFGDHGQLVGILIGDEAFGDLDEHVQRGAEHRDEAQHHEHAMAQRHLQRDVVDVQHAVEELLRDAVEPAALLPRVWPCRKRLQSMGVRVTETTPEIRMATRDRDREFLEQPAQHAAQEEHRNEHGGERQRHGDDGGADFRANP